MSEICNNLFVQSSVTLKDCNIYTDKVQIISGFWLQWFTSGCCFYRGLDWYHSLVPRGFRHTFVQHVRHEVLLLAKWINSLTYWYLLIWTHCTINCMIVFQAKERSVTNYVKFWILFFSTNMKLLLFIWNRNVSGRHMNKKEFGTNSSHSLNRK